MLNGNDVLILAARLLITTLFLIFGWRKLRDYSGTVSQMVQLGVPMPVLAAGVATFMRTAHTVNTLHLPMLLLHWAVVFGDLDLAFLICNRTLDQFELQGAIPVPDFLSQLWLPELRAFRQDPRFQVFATRLGLMEYWQQYGSPDEFDVKDGKLTYQ
jgi:hypothetical protein